MERVQTTIRLPAELYNELLLMAKETGLTITALLIAAIWWHALRLKSLRQ